MCRVKKPGSKSSVGAAVEGTSSKMGYLRLILNIFKLSLICMDGHEDGWTSGQSQWPNQGVGCSGDTEWSNLVSKWSNAGLQRRGPYPQGRQAKSLASRQGPRPRLVKSTSPTPGPTRHPPYHTPHSLQPPLPIAPATTHAPPLKAPRTAPLAPHPRRRTG